MFLNPSFINAVYHKLSETRFQLKEFYDWLATTPEYRSSSSMEDNSNRIQQINQLIISCAVPQQKSELLAEGVVLILMFFMRLDSNGYGASNVGLDPKIAEIQLLIENNLDQTIARLAHSLYGQEQLQESSDVFELDRDFLGPRRKEQLVHTCLDFKESDAGVFDPEPLKREVHRLIKETIRRERELYAKKFGLGFGFVGPMIILFLIYLSFYYMNVINFLSSLLLYSITSILCLFIPSLIPFLENFFDGDNPRRLSSQTRRNMRHELQDDEELMGLYDQYDRLTRVIPLMNFLNAHPMLTDKSETSIKDGVNTLLVLLYMNTANAKINLKRRPKKIYPLTECPICLIAVADKDKIVLACGHQVCRECLTKMTAAKLGTTFIASGTNTTISCPSKCTHDSPVVYEYESKSYQLNEDLAEKIKTSSTPVQRVLYKLNLIIQLNNFVKHFTTEQSVKDLINVSNEYEVKW